MEQYLLHLFSFVSELIAITVRKELVNRYGFCSTGLWTTRLNEPRPKLNALPHTQKASALNLSATLRSLFICVLRII